MKTSEIFLSFSKSSMTLKMLKVIKGLLLNYDIQEIKDALSDERVTTNKLSKLKSLKED